MRKVSSLFMLCGWFSCGLVWMLGGGAAHGQSIEEVSRRLSIPAETVKSIEEMRGTRPADLLGISKSKLPRLVLRARIHNIQQLRLEAYQQQTGTLDKPIPAGAKLLGSASFQKLQKAAVAGHVAGIPVGPPAPGKMLHIAKSISPGEWSWLGPGNVGGRTRGLVILPDKPETMFAGAAGGGIWRTDNAGESWLPVDDFMATLAVSALTIDPSNPKVLYAGTGEGFYNGDAMEGIGIFKSTDAGTTWQHLAATDKPDFYVVNRVAVSKAGHVFVATRNGIFASMDGGETWIRRLAGEIADVRCHPTDPKKAIAGDLRLGTIYFTNDGGFSWEVADRSQRWRGRVELCYAAADPKIVYASIDHEEGTLCRSEDGGASFTAVSAGVKYLGGQGWYDNLVWAGDPTNADFLMVAGVDMWRSTDGGKSLNRCSLWYVSDSIHADHHVIVPHPGFNGQDNLRVYFGCDGGVYSTENVRTVGGDVEYKRGWINLNNNYGVTQFVGGAANADSGLVVAGAQDNGTRVTRPDLGEQGWVEVQGGDGGYCAIDFEEPNRVFGQYIFCNLHRSVVAENVAESTSEYIVGEYWTGSNWEVKQPPQVIPEVIEQKANFYAPFVLDPNEPERLLAGAMSLWRSNNAREPVTATTGPEWRAIKPEIGGNRRQHPISALAVQQGRSDVIWVAHNNGRIFKTTDGTAASPTWKELGVDVLPQRFPNWITINPLNPDVAYIMYAGYEADNLWKTSDGGATWSSIGGSLPAIPFRCLAVHPLVSKYLYLGTELGVFASDDGGETWTPTNQGPANVAVTGLHFTKSSLVAVTYGRGVYIIHPQLSLPGGRN